MDGLFSPYDKHFIILEQFEKGRVRQCVLVDETMVDYQLVKAIAFEKARFGHDVDIMPTLNENDKWRSIIFYDAKGLKNPDLRIDGILHEVEQPQNPKSINNLKHRIDKGAKQADFIIIDLIESVTVGDLVRVCNGRFKDHKHLQLIEFRYEFEYIKMTRDEWAKKVPLKRGRHANP